MFHQTFSATYYTVYGCLMVGLLLCSLLSPFVSRTVDVSPSGTDGPDTVTRLECRLYGLLLTYQEGPPAELTPPPTIPGGGGNGGLQSSDSSSSSSSESSSDGAVDSSVPSTSSSSSQPSLSDGREDGKLPYFSVFSPSAEASCSLRSGSHQPTGSMRDGAPFPPLSTRARANYEKDCPFNRSPVAARESITKVEQRATVVRKYPGDNARVAAPLLGWLFSYPANVLDDKDRLFTASQGKKEHTTPSRIGALPTMGYVVAADHPTNPSGTESTDTEFSRSGSSSSSEGPSWSSGDSTETDDGKPATGQRISFSLKTNPFPQIRRACIAYLVLVVLGMLLSVTLACMALLQVVPVFGRGRHTINSLRGVMLALVLVTVACLAVTAALVAQDHFFEDVSDGFYLVRTPRRVPHRRLRSGFSSVLAAAIISVVAVVGIPFIRAD